MSVFAENLKKARNALGVTRKTDISIFKAMLNPTRQTVRA